MHIIRAIFKQRLCTVDVDIPNLSATDRKLSCVPENDNKFNLIPSYHSYTLSLKMFKNGAMTKTF